jgi:Raf kinase inhibitor-like YbhB/YbcL family protein
MKTRLLLLLLLFPAMFVPSVVSPGHGKPAQPLSASMAAAAQPGQQEFQAAEGEDREHHFRLSSTTFQKDQLIPATMVFNGQLGSVCTGGNESPQLSWTPAVPGTRSYAVALFDVTANFTHWGMYNIPPTTTALPAGAGAPGSGQQVFNDAGVQGYSGPCPPPGLVPNGIHRYVFTVYALDKELDLTPSPDFPPSADALYRAMIGHVIESASIIGLFSCTDANSCS